MSSRTVRRLLLLPIVALVAIFAWVAWADARMAREHDREHAGLGAVEDHPATAPTTVDLGSLPDPCPPGAISARHSGTEGAMQTAFVSFELVADRTCTVTRVEIAVGSAPGQPPPIVGQPPGSPLVLAVGAPATLLSQVFDTLADERRPCSDAIPFRLLVNGWDVVVAALPAKLFDCQVLRVSATRPSCVHNALDTRCRTAD